MPSVLPTVTPTTLPQCSQVLHCLTCVSENVCGSCAAGFALSGGACAMVPDTAGGQRLRSGVDRITAHAYHGHQRPQPLESFGLKE
jgi:hypothetical protein